MTDLRLNATAKLILDEVEQLHSKQKQPSSQSVVPESSVACAPQALFQRGYELEQSNRYFEAIKVWDEGLELASMTELNDWVVRICMAKAGLWTQLGDSNEVKRALQRATSAIFRDDFSEVEEDTYYELLLRHANVLIAEGEKGGARRLLMSLIHLEADVRVGAYLALIRADLDAGDLTGARNCLSALLEHQSLSEHSNDALRALVLQCEIEFLEGDSASSHQTAREAVRLLDALSRDSSHRQSWNSIRKHLNLIIRQTTDETSLN
ncbi:hypothetical protein KOR42_38910 [Thalassoglobus neptunius]|uniref:Tetratricopeptide repeat protein n=1 Tax=Thalassoglobus neptunius TaxID=1938619 RepID=A0A5C5WGB5_9PLAN|nr:hypothetical protein [Thalassoglobus neptunius]TWT49818.1 hypothetical protein KOR42_38910 [Thalassoglobus neptunius]